MHLRVTETAEASLAEAVAEASNKATVVVLRYMAWQRYHFHWAKHNGSGEFMSIQKKRIVIIFHLLTRIVRETSFMIMDIGGC